MIFIETITKARIYPYKLKSVLNLLQISKFKFENSGITDMQHKDKPTQNITCLFQWPSLTTTFGFPTSFKNKTMIKAGFVCSLIGKSCN